MPARQPLLLPFFSTGLYTNRQPLFHAPRNIGIQLVTYNDALIDGSNLEVTDHFTLRRRPPFIKFCSQQLAASEIVKQFYGVRDLSGNLTVLADTNQNLYKVTTSALTSLVSKGTSSQGYVVQVGNTTYYANGTDFKKWDGTTVTSWGIAPPKTNPIIAWGHFWYPGHGSSIGLIVDPNGNVQANTGSNFGGNTVPSWSPLQGGATYDGGYKWTNQGAVGQWQASTAVVVNDIIVDSNGNLQRVSIAGTTGSSNPAWDTDYGDSTTDNTVTWINVGSGGFLAYFGYRWTFAYRTIYGHLSTAAPLTTLSGPISGMQPGVITNFSITSNVVTITCANTLIAGDIVVIRGLTTGVYLNNVALTVASKTASAFTASFTHGDVGSTSDSGTVVLANTKITGLTTANSQCSATATITNIALTDNVLTVTCSNTFVPGLWVTLSSLGTATWLENQQVQIISATSGQFTAGFAHNDYASASDSGTVTFNAVEIYRTADGGGIPYFCGAVTNSGFGWTFYDAVPDSDLITTLIAPLYHLNDPPPGATGSIVGDGGTLLAYWNGRMWMAVGNKVYFSAGPDSLNGIPEESWPPAYVFSFPGQVTALRAQQGGVLVQTPDDYWAILGGPQTVAFYPDQFLSHIGGLSDNCLAQDGGDLYVFTAGAQFFSINATSKDEIGFRIGDVLLNGQAGILTAAAWAPATSSVTVHRGGYDAGVWLSNGADSLLRYGLNTQCWSPVYQPLLDGTKGCGVIKSVETAAGVWTLLLASNDAQDYIYYRDFDATVFADNGTGYDATAIIGNIIISEPGQPLQSVWSLSTLGQGTPSSVGFLANEISGTFSTLPVALNEPALLPASSTIIAKRYPLMANTTPTPILMRHIRIKVGYGSGTTASELYSLALGFDRDQGR